MLFPIGQTGRFRRDPAYKYLVEEDELPTYPEMTDSDPIAKVRLFLPNSRFTYYVTALTDYDGMKVMTGFCVSPLGADCDEFGDMGVSELIALRDPLFNALPIERDRDWVPTPISAIRQAVPA